MRSDDLQHFFTCYFTQDFDYDYDCWEDAVDDFSRGPAYDRASFDDMREFRKVVTRTSVAITELVERLSPAELEGEFDKNGWTSFTDDLGAWLLLVADRLLYPPLFAGGHPRTTYIDRGAAWLADRANNRLTGFAGTQGVDSTQWRSRDFREDALRVAFADPQNVARIDKFTGQPAMRALTVRGRYRVPDRNPGEPIVPGATGVRAWTETEISLGDEFDYLMVLFKAPRLARGFLTYSFCPVMP